MQLQLIRKAIKKANSRKEYMHLHYMKNREKYLKRAAEYRKNNPEKIKSYNTPEKKAKKAAYMREYRLVYARNKAHKEECQKERKRTSANWMREKRAKEKCENINKDNVRQKIAEIAEKMLKEFS